MRPAPALVRALVAGGLSLLTATASSAQTTSASPPPVSVAPVNILLPNYNSVPIGEIGGLEGGAFLARAKDSSAVFYNPAGLPRAEQTSVSGSAGVYQFGTTSADGFDTPGSAMQQVPAMFAFVLKDVGGRRDLSAGLSVARTAAWRNVVDLERTTESSGSTDRLSYSSAAALDTWLASGGVGYGGHGRWRAGASIDLQFTDTERRQTLANQYRAAGSLAAVSVTGRSEARASHLRFTLGSQYDLAPTVIVGAVLRTGGLGLHATGMTMLEGLSASTAGTTTASFFDDDVDVTYRVPLEFRTGIAYVGARAQVEFDLRLYDGAGTYNAYDSDRRVTVIDAVPGIPASVSDIAVRPPVIDSRAVTDIAIGGQLKLTSMGSWVAHGGYSTDRSPVGDLDTVFTKVNLQQVSAGLSARTRHFLGSLGILYLTGTSDPIALRELPAGQLTTTVAVRSLGVVYSLSVLF